MPNIRFSSKLKISLIKLEDVVDAILVVEGLEITVKNTSNPTDKNAYFLLRFCKGKTLVGLLQ